MFVNDRATHPALESTRPHPMTPEFTDAIRSLHHFAAVAVTAMVIGLTVGLHYEVLQQLNRRMPRMEVRASPAHPHHDLLRCRCAHRRDLAVWYRDLHGAGAGDGEISGSETFHLLDAVYVSATTYSTLGYGDLVPQGPVRFLLLHRVAGRAGDDHLVCVFRLSRDGPLLARQALRRPLRSPA